MIKKNTYLAFLRAIIEITETTKKSYVKGVSLLLQVKSLDLLFRLTMMHSMLHSIV